MARTLLLLGFCSLGFCSLALAQTPPETDWRFAHPDADMKMSLNLQALLNSPAIAKAIEQGKSQAKDNAMQIELALAMLKTVDRISVSVRQKAVPQAVRDKAAGGMVSDSPDVLVQVTGAFDSQLIAGLFPSTGTSKVKVVGPHTLLIGDGDSFARAAERMTVGAPTPGDELEQSDIWISASSSFLAQQANGTGQPTMPFFQGVRGLSVGLNLSETPEVNLLWTAVDDAAASELLKTLQQVAPMADAAVKALSLKQDGSTIRVHFVVPPELVALAQQQVASGGLPSQWAPLLGSFGMGGFGPAKSAKPAVGAIAHEPPPQNGGKVMIYGLDDGPKQIPAK